MKTKQTYPERMQDQVRQMKKGQYIQHVANSWFGYGNKGATLEYYRIIDLVHSSGEPATTAVIERCDKPDHRKSIYDSAGISLYCNLVLSDGEPLMKPPKVWRTEKRKKEVTE